MAQWQNIDPIAEGNSGELAASKINQAFNQLNDFLTKNGMIEGDGAGNFTALEYLALFTKFLSAEFGNGILVSLGAGAGATSNNKLTFDQSLFRLVGNHKQSGTPSSNIRNDYAVHAQPNSELENTTSTISAMVRNSENAQGPLFSLAKTRGTTNGGVAAVQQNDVLGGIYFHGADGTDLNLGARIDVLVDGAVSAGIVPSRFVFRVATSAGTVPDALTLFSNRTAQFFGTVSGVDPTADNHLATKKYVDDSIPTGTVTETEGTYTATGATSSSGITLGALSKLEYTRTGQVYHITGGIEVTTTTTGLKIVEIQPGLSLPNIPDQAATGVCGSRDPIRYATGHVVAASTLGNESRFNLFFDATSTSGVYYVQWSFSYNISK